MARPPKEAAVASQLAPALARWVRARGADAEALTEQVGLDARVIDDDEASVTPTLLARMFRGASELVADPHAALSFAPELPVLRYDAVTLALRAARTPHEVLELAARYAPLLFPQLEASVTTERGQIALRARIAGHPRGLGHHVDEYVLALLLGHCRRVEGPLAPARAWLSSARPRTLAPLLRALGTDEVELGAPDTGLALSTRDAERALPGGDAAMLRTAQQLASASLDEVPRPNALAAAVSAKIEAAWSGASALDPTTESVAAALHMSARTLQRRLEGEGTRFSDLLDRARERTARRLLGDPSLGLAEIAHRVGFSDLAAFSRAFKRWTGVPPGAFRRRDG